MILHIELTPQQIHRLIRRKAIRFGGNRRLKIYGLLNCSSGKWLKVENRVFFSSEADAVNSGFRPCGRCMKTEYLKWKKEQMVPEVNVVG